MGKHGELSEDEEEPEEEERTDGTLKRLDHNELDQCPCHEYANEVVDEPSVREEDHI